MVWFNAFLYCKFEDENNVRDEIINCEEIESLIIFQNIRYALFFIILYKLYSLRQSFHSNIFCLYFTA